MKWNIITDSSCDLFPASFKGGELQISNVPFIISVGDKDFIDNETLNTFHMLDTMEHCSQPSRTSCPSPQSWLEEFEKADLCIAITISSKLSGSMNSAVLAKKMALERCPEKKIAVLDSLSTGPKIAMCVEKIQSLIENGSCFEEVVSEAENYLCNTNTSFALSSFNNLVKNGRMNKAAGFIAGKLGIWLIGIGTSDGTIAVKGKARGTAKVITMLVKDMEERGFHGGKVVISHCLNLPLAERLQSKIKDLWTDAKVSVLPTRGLCSYYAERGGLIVSFRIKTARES